jgi:hypothetical protein
MVVGGRNRSTIDGFGVEMDEREMSKRAFGFYSQDFFWMSVSMNDVLLLLERKRRRRYLTVEIRRRSMQGAKSQFYMCH